MAGEIKLKVKVDTTQVDAAQAKINKMGSAKAIQNGVAKFNGIAGNSGINLGGIGNFANKLGGITKMIGPMGVAFAGVVGAAKLFVSTMNGMIEKGKKSFDDYEQAVAKTRIQMSNYAPGSSAESVVSDFQLASENGVASVDHLVSTFNNLLPVLDGNVESGKELTLLLADMEAAGKGTASDITNLIAKVKEQGEVTSKDVKQIESKGLPIYRELAKVRQEEEEATRQAVKKGKVNADEFVEALKGVAEAYKGTAAELSATTEGAKASMEAAKGRAYKGAAEGASLVLKGYYASEQARYDAMADNPLEQQQMREAAMNFLAGVVQFNKICDRLTNGLENVFGWIASKMGWKREVVADYAQSLVANGEQRANIAQDSYNKYMLNRQQAQGDNEKDTMALADYLATQLKVLRGIADAASDVLYSPEYEEAARYIEEIEEKRTSKDPFKRRAARDMMREDKYIDSKRLVESGDLIEEEWEEVAKQINEVLSMRGVDSMIAESTIKSESNIEDLQAYYQQLIDSIRKQKEREAKLAQELARGKQQEGVINEMYDAYAERAIKRNKQDLIDNGNLDKYRSGTYRANSGYVVEGEGVPTSIEWDKIIDSTAKTAIEKHLTEWLTKELFTEFTNVDGVLKQVGTGAVSYADAKQYVDEFETKIGELYSAIQDKVGSDRYTTARDKLSELFGVETQINDDDSLKSAIQEQINAYNAINKALEDVAKTATEYIQEQERKAKELRDKLLAAKREEELKVIETEQFTKTDSYNSLKSYKRKLEHAKREDGTALYSDKEIRKLVRQMGNKMLEEQRKSNTIKDNGRWVNAHRVQAADGYIGAKVAGYLIRDTKTEEQIKQAKEANKKLTEIKQAIKEVDKTPRAV